MNWRERETDAAFNLARILRDQLRVAQGFGARTQKSAAPARSAARKQKLHAWLDQLQSLTPEFLRAAIRPVYLNLFYRRVYPEYARRAEPVPPPLTNALTAWSGYASFLEYKQRVCRNLPMDFSGFSCHCTPGMVSVVLPVYNGARFLAESIESVLRQTYRHLELLIVDDGSTDESAAIAKRYESDARVRLIRQKNRRLPGALNTGFAQATGEFFTWTSADNLMKPHMLAELVSFLSANRDAEMVFADEELIDEAGQPAVDSDFCIDYQTGHGGSVLSRPMDPGELGFVQNNYIGGCFLYRAWTGRAVGRYSERCFGFEDYDFWLRLNALFRIAHLGRREPLYLYRLHPHSLTASDKELQIAERARYYLPHEEERRRLFASGFDILLEGEHPWFPALASLYRRAGHNVFEMRTRSEETLYTYRVTRAFPKSVAILAAEWREGYFAALDGNTLRIAGQTWNATHAPALAYPLLAMANSRLL